MKKSVNKLVSVFAVMALTFASFVALNLTQKIEKAHAALPTLALDLSTLTASISTSSDYAYDLSSGELTISYPANVYLTGIPSASLQKVTAASGEIIVSGVALNSGQDVEFVGNVKIVKDGLDARKGSTVRFDASSAGTISVDASEGAVEFKLDGTLYLNADHISGISVTKAAPNDATINITQNAQILNYAGTTATGFTITVSGDGTINGTDALPTGIDASSFTGTKTAARVFVPVNTKQGVCDAPGLSSQTPNAQQDTNLSANEALSKGSPADAVFCQINVNVEVLETISLKVSETDVQIPTPMTGGTTYGFAESGGTSSPLEASVDTNSADGYQLLIKGVTNATNNANCSVALLCVDSSTSTIATGDFAFPTAQPTNLSDVKWGYRAKVGDIVKTEMCIGRKAGNPAVDTSAAATSSGDCTSGSETSADGGVIGFISGGAVTPGTWEIISGDGSAAAASAFAAASSASDKFAAIPTTDAPLISGTPTTSNLVVAPETCGTAGNATTCSSQALFKKPVSSAKTFFRFGLQITTATPAGKYNGTVRLTAVPTT